MKVAVIGAGHVGSALGNAWIKTGHDVIFGVAKRDDKAGKDAAKHFNVATAIQQTEVVVLALPWPSVPEVLASNQDSLKGKVLIDATNPLRADFSGMEDGYSISGAERVAQWAPGASVFKAFNQTGFENMEDAGAYSSLPGRPRPVMFFCGDEADRRSQVAQLVDDAGFEAVDAGPLESARLLEPYGMLWIRLAGAQKMGRRFAFSLIRLPNE